MFEILGTNRSLICKRLVPIFSLRLNNPGGSINDFITLFKDIPDIDAGLAASIFHFGEVRIADLKKELSENGITVRSLPDACNVKK